jgi:hypothetical protein
MVEIVSGGKRMAFLDDNAAHQYSERKRGFELPQLKPEDNKLLDTMTLRFFNALLEKCLSIDPTKRPSVENLIAILSNEARKQMCM